MQQAELTMGQWKIHICAGNRCFEAEQNMTASGHYHRAIALADALLSGHDDPRAAVAALLVSHHNLADLYLRANQLTLAEDELRSVHQKLSLALNGVQPNTAQSDALLWGVSRSYFALIAHCKNHPAQVTCVPETSPEFEVNHFKNTIN